MVGAFRRRKGYGWALQAWPTVLGHCPEARLLFVGTGPEEASLRDRAAELGVSDSLVFGGMRSDIPEVLRASSVALLPSESEALPATLMEAAACGIAVVAHRVEGVTEVVSDGETGLLVAVPERGP
jgi:glycosyltransferase involved in cell wall biosynthesis